jgi:AcrR family transcriptional regulator
MEQPTGLRERKKEATRQLLMATALDLFEERGFDNVSVAEVAAAAEVSKATVFNYFPTKEDLVLAGAKAHIEEPARIVRERPVGQTPHGATREYFLAMLERREPLTGLSTHPIFHRVQRLIRTHSGLQMRGMEYRRQSAELLAKTLIDEGSAEVTAHLVASQLMHTQHLLAGENLKRIAAGESPEAVYPDAVDTADQAFRLLEHGIGDFMRREADAGPARLIGGPPDPDVAEQAMDEAVDTVLRALADPDGC